MKLIAETVSEILAKEDVKKILTNEVKDLEDTLRMMKQAGLIAKPGYNFPMVDTIGKNYYHLINKRY